MTQITARSLGMALAWIRCVAHYEVGTIYSTSAERRGIFYRNHFETLRVLDSEPWATRFHRLIKSNTRPHDDRMFMLTKTGRRYLLDNPTDWIEHGEQLTRGQIREYLKRHP